MPRSHQVEAVNFAITLNGRTSALHIAIAVVTRKNGEDLVLRQTGQVIGDTDRGVDQLYQHILGCDHHGFALTDEEAETLAERFWKGFRDPKQD
jgi:hypothetical protein